MNFEAQENKAHHYGTYYHLGRAKSFGFILQVPKEHDLFFSEERFIKVHQVGSEGMIDS